ncbi:MAG: hypothetical protein V1816_18205, partial [Pseudomonadota bacterium]
PYKLHAKAYTPAEAVSSGLFQGLHTRGRDPASELEQEIDSLGPLKPKAYRLTKAALRNKDIDVVLARRKQEPAP